MNCNAMWETCGKNLPCIYMHWKPRDVSTSKVYWPQLGRQVEREPPQECQLDFKTHRKQMNVDV